MSCYLNRIVQNQIWLWLQMDLKIECQDCASIFTLFQFLFSFYKVLEAFDELTKARNEELKKSNIKYRAKRSTSKLDHLQAK